MQLKTIEQERAEAEAMVKDMRLVGSVRRLEQSMYIYPSDDYDMDTTETLYTDGKGYYMRVEQYHDFMSADDVYKISRAEAREWTRENARAEYEAPRRRRRQIHKANGKSRLYGFLKMVAKKWRRAVK